MIHLGQERRSASQRRLPPKPKCQYSETVSTLPGSCLSRSAGRVGVVWTAARRSPWAGWKGGTLTPPSAGEQQQRQRACAEHTHRCRKPGMVGHAPGVTAVTLSVMWLRLTVQVVGVGHGSSHRFPRSALPLCKAHQGVPKCSRQSQAGPSARGALSRQIVMRPVTFVIQESVVLS